MDLGFRRRAGLPWIWISMDGLVISMDIVDIHRIFNNRDAVIIKLAILLSTLTKYTSKIIFSAPISSAAVERLFSQAGNLLSKMRKRMSPAVMKKLVYIRYQKKYITIIKKLGIVIEPEEVAKIINNEPMSLSFEDDSDIEEFMNDSLHNI